MIPQTFDAQTKLGFAPHRCDDCSSWFWASKYLNGGRKYCRECYRVHFVSVPPYPFAKSLTEEESQFLAENPLPVAQAVHNAQENYTISEKANIISRVLGDKINKGRKGPRATSAEGFAEEAGVTGVTIANIINGKVSPNSTTINKIEQAIRARGWWPTKEETAEKKPVQEVTSIYKKKSGKIIEFIGDNNEIPCDLLPIGMYAEQIATKNNDGTTTVINVPHFFFFSKP